MPVAHMKAARITEQNPWPAPRIRWIPYITIQPIPDAITGRSGVSCRYERDNYPNLLLPSLPKARCIHASGLRVAHLLLHPLTADTPTSYTGDTVSPLAALCVTQNVE